MSHGLGEEGLNLRNLRKIQENLVKAKKEEDARKCK
jgi:hypothetical protein